MISRRAKSRRLCDCRYFLALVLACIEKKQIQENCNIDIILFMVYNVCKRGDEMDILTIKEASLMWGISVRRINVLCNEGRIIGAKKIAGAWLLPKDSKKPADARIKAGKYTDWRNKSDMKSNDFESNLKNLKGTFAVESMAVSKEGIKNLKRIDSGKVSYTDVIEELKHKYMQRA